jgi:tRNA pseudouridine55 synthase
MEQPSSRSSFDFLNGEILLIEKPLSWTSFDVVGYLRKVIRHHLGIKKIKIGHAGTLDPLASGLLIICTGKFTKRITEFIGLEKEYTGRFILGATRPSFDKETEIDHIFPTDHLTPELILQTASRFIGEQKQVPPTFSATKVKGMPAYIYAREKQHVEIEPKTVFISEFEITTAQIPAIEFRIVCSKGTYIRAIARDLGESLGCGAYLDSLCRTRIGDHRLEEAMDLDTITRTIQETSPQLH